MSEFEDKINNLLSDPEEMGRLAQLASQLMDGGLPGAPPPKGGQEPSEPDLMAMVGKVMGGLGGGKKAPLTSALGPYLGENRRSRLEKAMRMAQMAKMAGTVFSQFGGDGDV